MPKNEKIKVVRGTKKPLSERLAAKICGPYMDMVLQSCYSLRTLCYALSYEDWCIILLLS